MTTTIATPAVDLAAPLTDAALAAMSIPAREAYLIAYKTALAEFSTYQDEVSADAEADAEAEADFRAEVYWENRYAHLAWDDEDYFLAA